SRARSLTVAMCPRIVRGMFRAALRLLLAFALGSLAGCKKNATAAVDPALENPLIPTPGEGPAGTGWQRVPPQGGVGSVELPNGEGWTRGAAELLEMINDKLDITVIVGTQPDVGADSRAEYMQSLAGNNKRDA